VGAGFGLGDRLPPPPGVSFAAHAVDHVRVVQLEGGAFGPDPRQGQGSLRRGGELVTHSSCRSRGSPAVVISPYRQDRMMFQMNGSVDAPSTNAPIVEMVLNRVNPSVGR